MERGHVTIPICFRAVVDGNHIFLEGASQEHVYLVVQRHIVSVAVARLGMAHKCHTLFDELLDFFRDACSCDIGFSRASLQF